MFDPRLPLVIILSLLAVGSLLVAAAKKNEGPDDPLPALTTACWTIAALIYLSFIPLIPWLIVSVFYHS